MTRQTRPRSPTESLVGHNLDAFQRFRGEVPSGSSSALVRALDDVLPSDDPAVTFASMASACVPEFADGCGVELSDGEQAIFSAKFPARSPRRGDQCCADGEPAPAEHSLHTPFRVASRSGYPAYSGVVTHWWTGRGRAGYEAVVADLMARHAIALVDRERLMAVMGRSDDRAKEVTLQAISGRTINLAIGIVMHQRGSSPDDAEDLLRRASRVKGSSLYETAAHVIRAGSLADPPIRGTGADGRSTPRNRPLRAARQPE